MAYLLSNYDGIHSGLNQIQALSHLGLAGSVSQETSTYGSEADFIVGTPQTLRSGEGGGDETLITFTGGETHELQTEVTGEAIYISGHREQLSSVYALLVRRQDVTGNKEQLSSIASVLKNKMPIIGSATQLTAVDSDLERRRPLLGLAKQITGIIAGLDASFHLVGEAAQKTIVHGDVSTLMEGHVIQRSLISTSSLTVRAPLTAAHVYQLTSTSASLEHNVNLIGRAEQLNSIATLLGLEDYVLGQANNRTRVSAKMLLGVESPIPIATVIDEIAYQLETYEALVRQPIESPGAKTPEPVKGTVIQESSAYAYFSQTTKYLTGNVEQLSSIFGYVKEGRILLRSHPFQLTSVHGNVSNTLGRAYQLTSTRAVLEHNLDVIGNATQLSSIESGLGPTENLVGNAVQSSLVYGVFITPIVGTCFQLNYAYGILQDAITGHSLQLSSISGEITEAFPIDGYAYQLSSINVPSLSLYKSEPLAGNVIQESSTAGFAEVKDVMLAFKEQLSSSYGNVTRQPVVHGEAKQLTNVEAWLENEMLHVGNAAQRSSVIGAVGTEDYLPDGAADQLSSVLAELSPLRPLLGNASQLSEISGALDVSRKALYGDAEQNTSALGGVRLTHVLTGDASQLSSGRAYFSKTTKRLFDSHAAQLSVVNTDLEKRIYLPAGHVAQLTKSVGNIRDSAIGWIDCPSLILYEDC